MVVGGFFGDEGKGKIIAHIAKEDKPSIVARGGVGPNAGHTVQVGDEKHGVRMIPSGFVYERARLLIGAGVLVDPDVFLREVSLLKVHDRIKMDKRCSIIEARHIEGDKNPKIGTTGTGCGPANVDRIKRSARQAGDVDSLRDFLTDVAVELNDALDRGENVLIEGTQGFGLSLFHGTYPYVTSKDTSASQIAADVGIGPTKVDEVIVVFKAFPTRVGEGPFKTEMSEEESKEMGIEEFGTVTGRRRRIGRWDGVMARYSVMVNGATQAALTGLDKIDPSCRGVRDYSELSEKVKAFVEETKSDAGIPFTLLSTGPETDEIIDLRSSDDL
jgi:adenylosuccinate synthase